MAERCRHAYRKRGKNAVFCKNMPDEYMNYCVKQVMCRQTNRWEASECLVDNCSWFDPIPEPNIGMDEEPEKVVEEPEAPKKTTRKKTTK